jgi:hypothetical protein
VHEQAADKLSVRFDDLGEQEVKNIPNPVHAYMLAIRGTGSAARRRSIRKSARWIWPAASVAALLLVAGVGGGIYLVRASKSDAASEASSAPGPVEPPQPSPPQRQPAALVPERIPFLSGRQRGDIRNEYLPAKDHKALAINSARIGFITGQPDEETAKSVALERCRKASESLRIQRPCELYAVGMTVVHTGGLPPLPPEPWVLRDPAVERAFVAGDLPFVDDAKREAINKGYTPARKSKALAISSRGSYSFYVGQASQDEAIRRGLELCGNIAGIPCMIVAIDDAFVAPIPATMRVVGLFRPAFASAILPELRTDVAQRLANATTGWKATAVGADGRAGLGLRAATEQEAVTAALEDCSKQDRACRVVAIGPFSVEPK